MTLEQFRLLYALLDALDRLHDRQCGLVDFQALTAATGVALSDSPEWSRRLRNVSIALSLLLASDVDAEEQYRHSLRVTDELRRELAALQ